VPRTADGTVEMIRQVKIAKDTAVKSRSQAIITLKTLVITAPAELRPLGDRDLTAGLPTEELIKYRYAVLIAWLRRRHVARARARNIGGLLTSPLRVASRDLLSSGRLLDLLKMRPPIN